MKIVADKLSLKKEDIKIRDTAVPVKGTKIDDKTLMSLNGLQVNGIVKFEIVKKIVARDSNSCRELTFAGEDGKTTISEMIKLISKKL